MGSSEIEGNCPQHLVCQGKFFGNKSLCSSFWSCSLFSRCYLCNCPQALGCMEATRNSDRENWLYFGDALPITWEAISMLVPFWTVEKVGEGLDEAVLCVVQRPLLQEVGPSGPHFYQESLLSPYSKPLFINIRAPVHKHKSFKRPEWLCIQR